MRAWTLSTAILLCCGSLANAQINALSIGPPEKTTAKIGSTVDVKTAVRVHPGYHCNSSTPTEDYLIPLRLTWTEGPLESPIVEYPKPQMEKFSFSDKPLSVYNGDFVITTKFKVAANADPGTAFVTGKLRYQACNDRMCMPPKTIDVSIPVDIIR